MRYKFLFFLLFLHHSLFSAIQLGIDVFASESSYKSLIENKGIALIANQSAVNRDYKKTLDILLNHGIQVSKIYAPEHGYFGGVDAGELFSESWIRDIPILRSYGSTKRPTEAMLENVDVVIYDIQDIGSRSFTYLSTLLYFMEEAAKKNISIIVLDRPNPMGGHIVDGLLMDDQHRSFISYVSVPYCHGMTIGELALFFNTEYKVGCDLTVVPMRGWKRGMIFEETGLPWVPLSPQIPEVDTPFYYATTGLIGQWSFMNNGVGYTLPFKILGAPWADAIKMADILNAQKLPGVLFEPFHFTPYYALFAMEHCEGVRIIITDKKTFLPVSTQYTIIDVLKDLYPNEFTESMQTLKKVQWKENSFNALNGSIDIGKIICNEKYFISRLCEMIRKDCEYFIPIRNKYLIY